jgi:hypothetical protein
MAFELHVDDGADDLGDTSGLVGGCGHENFSINFKDSEVRNLNGGP